MDAEKIWGNISKVILGEEIGPVADYISYFKKYVPQGREAESSLSGEEILVGSEYPKGTKLISANETDRYMRIIKEPELDINSIKDIDSITEALEEKVYYAGNILLGNSKDAIVSNCIIDSSSVYRSQYVFYSKNVVYCTHIRYQENVIGSENVGGKGGGNFVIKGFRVYFSNRVMECVFSNSVSDCFYSANLMGCSDCLFSFNLRAKRRCIGNLELPQDKFSALKKKLVDEIRETLKSKHDLPSIIDIIRAGGDNETD